MKIIEVFAEIACPFTPAGLCRLIEYRRRHGSADTLFRVRAWPLELINGRALDGSGLKPKIDALRAGVAPELFTGFDEHRFTATTLPALASEAAAYRTGIEVGERFSLAVRHALFEEGMDVSSDAVLRSIRQRLDAADPIEADWEAVSADLTEGRRRGVLGSPHFFT